MSKYEKYWVFGMIMFLSITHKEVPTLLNSIGNVIAYMGGVGFSIAMIWCFVRGEK